MSTVMMIERRQFVEGIIKDILVCRARNHTSNSRLWQQVSSDNLVNSPTRHFVDVAQEANLPFGEAVPRVVDTAVLTASVAAFPVDLWSLPRKVREDVVLSIAVEVGSFPSTPRRAMPCIEHPIGDLLCLAKRLAIRSAIIKRKVEYPSVITLLRIPAPRHQGLMVP
ncbi:hypothetical protein [Azospirillum endophyticum]